MTEPRYRIASDPAPVSERRLRGGLSRGEYSGLELVTTEDGTRGLLCELPVFAEAVPMMGGDDPRQLALARERSKMKKAFLRMWPFVFVLGIVFANALAGRIQVSEVTGVAIVMVALAVFQSRHAWPSLKRIRQANRNPAPIEGERIHQALAGDPMAEALGGELAEVDEAMRRLRNKADQLARRIEAERALDIPGQLAAVQTQAGTTTSQATRSALQSEAVSLQERLNALQGAEDTLVELQSRLRTYGHQVASLKTLLAQQGGHDAVTDGVLDEVKALRRRVAAEAEARSFGR